LNFPYERAIRFLISRKVDVNTALKRLKLPVLEWREEMARRNRLKGGALPPVVDAYFRSEQVLINGSQAFLAWAQAEEIDELWSRQAEFSKRNDDLNEACRAFANPALRTVLGLLLMAGFSNDEVIEVIYQRSEFKLTAAAVELFKKLFWDVKVMRKEDWLSLLDDMEKDQRTLLSLAFEGKGRNYIKFALGVVPEVDLRDVLTNIMTKAHMRFNEMLELPDYNEAQAIAWAQLAMKAGEKRKNSGGGPSRNLSEDLQLQLQNDDPEFPTLAELNASAGSIESGN